jgi:hypothetical protein
VNRELTQKIDESEKRILAELHSMRTELMAEKTSFADRLSKIEIWKYTVVGALMIVSWLAAKIDIIKILFPH